MASGGARLEWNAQRFRCSTGPTGGWWSPARASPRFDGKKLGLAGELRADSGRFDFSADRLPQLADDIVVVGGRSASRAARARPLPVDLDMRVDLGEDLTLRGCGFDGGSPGSCSW